MTTAWKCILWGRPRKIAERSSELQLHQVGVAAGGIEAACPQTVGKFSDGHGDFIAGVATGAVDAVLFHFVWQRLTFNDAEVKVLEEGGNASEEADALDAADFGLIEEGAHEQAAGSGFLGFGIDDDGADLGEVPAVDVECSATDELASAGFSDGEGMDVGADFRIGAKEECVVVGEAVD